MTRIKLIFPVAHLAAQLSNELAAIIEVHTAQIPFRSLLLTNVDSPSNPRWQSPLPVLVFHFRNALQELRIKDSICVKMPRLLVGAYVPTVEQFDISRMDRIRT